MPQAEDVPRGEEGGHHRVVLVVVFVQAVAAGEVEGREAGVEFGANRRDVCGVLVVIDRVGLRLTDDAAIAEYLDAALEEDDPDIFLLALSDVARARGMANVARETGLGRESLYKTLAPGAKPRFDTIVKVARALGVRFTAHAV